MPTSEREREGEGHLLDTKSCPQSLASNQTVIKTTHQCAFLIAALEEKHYP